MRPLVLLLDAVMLAGAQCKVGTFNQTQVLTACYRFTTCKRTLLASTTVRERWGRKQQKQAHGPFAGCTDPGEAQDGYASVVLQIDSA